jgi:GDPmannose 4,6-dehydratase
MSQMHKKALITGITGQDGAYLAKFLLSKGYKAYGTYRRLSSPNFWRLQYLDIFDKVELIPAELSDSGSLFEAIRISNPDEIYNLAAQSFVGASFEQPVNTADVSGIATTRILELVRQINPKIRFYQASTSELYGGIYEHIQDEDVPFHPRSPYAAAKLYSYWITRIYREAYGLFAANGILFNHESPLRGLEFVTRKISNAVAKISLGIDKNLSLGNIEAKRDWGYAVDYVESMWMILQQEKPQDFVVATGETHSIEEFLDVAFKLVNLDYQKHIVVDKKFFRPLEVHKLCGDCSKAKKILGWTPKVTFKELIEIMVKEDMQRWEGWLKGKRFPWDAINYPDERKILSRYISKDD